MLGSTLEPVNRRTSGEVSVQKAARSSGLPLTLVSTDGAVTAMHLTPSSVATALRVRAAGLHADDAGGVAICFRRHLRVEQLLLSDLRVAPGPEAFLGHVLLDVADGGLRIHHLRPVLTLIGVLHPWPGARSRRSPVRLRERDAAAGG